MTLPSFLRGGGRYRDVLRTIGLSPKVAYLVAEHWPDPMTLMGATESQLRHLGVTPTQARRLRGAANLAVLANEVPPRPEIRGVDDVIAAVGPTMVWAEQEMFAVLSLDHRDGLIDLSTVAVGDNHRVRVSARMVFRRAVRAAAYSVVLVHNHPSGVLEPSNADIVLTHQMGRVGNVLGIPLADHIIVARGGRSCSLASMGVVQPRIKV